MVEGGEAVRMNSDGRRKRLLVRRHELGPANIFPRGNTECGPPHAIDKLSHAMSQGRCDGMMKTDLRASVEQERVGSSKSASRSLFCHLQKFH